MNRTSRIATAVAATTGAFGLLTGTAQAAVPPPEGPTATYTEQRYNPFTGRTEMARVTEYPDVIVRPAGTVVPAAGTGGLYLRIASGTITGLMAEGDQARFLGCHPTNPGLIRVRQITHGHGGWGAYEGYVKARATTTPEQFPCGG
ncbi:hypothetical protein ACIQU6_38365 [Streptomyces sp. NPDC090442]|uniref:hypothetical protein n=1 Tax=Streptomyces sp. NPDC090442 TaxID=3365962 RepID=UPI0037FA59B6